MSYTTTPTHGKVARLEKNDVAVDYIGGWNLNFAIDMAPQERQGQNWKDNTPGQASWAGDFKGHCVLGNTEQKALHDNLGTASPGTKLTDMKFLIDGSTEGWNGDIYINNINVSAPVGGHVDISFTFVGSGAPSLSDSQ